MGLKDRQLAGLKVIILFAVIVCMTVSARFWNHPAKMEIPYGSIRSGPVVVELAGEVPRAGIYYLPARTTLAEFMEIAGIALPTAAAKEANRPLTAGIAVRVGAYGQASLERMSAARRLSLNLPVDINRATYEEILMVPGVGEKTARQIVALRGASAGGIRRIDELKKIKGIKEKRLENLRRYFFIEKG